VPILEKASSRRRSFGDLVAVLLLLAVLGGAVWLWWHQKNSLKKTPPASVSKPVSKPAAKPLADPSKQIVPPLVLPTNKIAPPKTVEPKPIVIPLSTGANFPRPVRDTLEMQVALARRAISPGSLDAANGSQTRAALGAFQRSMKLPESAALDTNTRSLLTLAAPLLTNYLVSSNDLARVQPLGKTWLEKSQQTALAYETILELVAEKAHSHPLLIQKLNPGVNWTNFLPGLALKVPDVSYPEPEEQAAFVIIHLSGKYLEAFGAATNLLLHCPCSIAAKVEKRPVGSLKVSVLAPDPNYTFDPSVFPESPEAQALGRKLILQPGPNNPVGEAWIGLDRTGYGMHGTPNPEQVGRTESHGCFRLANWDAEYLVKLAWVGMPVEVVP
jgi:lipoprotein-anchoring transpeptidase ErfK/SrfK